MVGLMISLRYDRKSKFPNYIVLLLGKFISNNTFNSSKNLMNRTIAADGAVE